MKYGFMHKYVCVITNYMNTRVIFIAHACRYIKLSLLNNLMSKLEWEVNLIN